MRSVGGAVVSVAFGVLGVAGTASSNDEARIAAYSAIAVAVVTATGTIIGQVVAAHNRKPPAKSPNDELLELAVLALLDSHATDPETRADAEQLAAHVREHMKQQRRDRIKAAEGSGAVAPPRPTRRRRRAVGRRPEGGSGDGEDES